MANPPTEDLSYATSGIKTPSTPSERSDGFEMGYIHDDGSVVNYRWDGQHQKIEWLEGQPSRIVTDLRTAIDDSVVYLTGTEFFAFDGEQGWDDGDVTKTTPGAVTHMVTDSRRVYYLVGTTLYAVTADAVTDEQNEWSYPMPWLSGADINIKISTDGVRVAVFGLGTTLKTRMDVVNVDGTLSWTDTSATSVPDGIPGIIMSGDANGTKCWVGNSDVAGYPIYRATPGLGFQPFLALGLGNVAKKIALTQNAILIGNDGNVGFVDKRFFSTGGIIKSVAISGAELQWLFGRDDLFAYGTSGVAGAAPLATNLGNTGEVASSNVLGDGGPSVWGDGRLFTPSRVINSRGVVEHVFAVPSDGDISLAGQYLWAVIGGALVARPIQMDRGSLWIRHILPNMLLNTNESQASTRLITKMMW